MAEYNDVYGYLLLIFSTIIMRSVEREEDRDSWPGKHWIRNCTKAGSIWVQHLISLKEEEIICSVSILLGRPWPSHQLWMSYGLLYFNRRDSPYNRPRSAVSFGERRRGYQRGAGTPRQRKKSCEVSNGGWNWRCRTWCFWEWTRGSLGARGDG